MLAAEILTTLVQGRIALDRSHPLLVFSPSNSQKYLASVDEVSWFKRPVPVRASKGLFRIVVPSDVLADDLRCSLQEIVTEDNTRGEDGTGLAECSAASLTSHMFRKDEGELAARDSPCRR